MWLFIVVLLVLIMSAVHLMKTPTGRNLPPTPWWRWPLVGHRPLVQKMGGLANATDYLAKKYKSEVVGIFASGTYSVTACTPATVMEVLTKPEFQARPNNYFTYLRSMMTSKGVTMTDGPHWQEQRTFLIKELSQAGFGRNLMNTMIEDSLKQLLTVLGDGGGEVKMSSIISKSVINILWKIVTGEEIPDTTLQELTSLMGARSRAFDQAGGWLAQMPWLRFIFPQWSGYNIILRLNKQLKQFIDQTIQEHKDTYQEGVIRDFIDSFLQKMYEENSYNSTFTDDQLMMVCLDLFVGGIMTTTSTLDFCFLRLVHHPDVQEKVHAELDSVLGGQLPVAADLERLPYIKAVVNECMRISTMVIVNGPRRALENATLGGYNIPEGSTVFMNMVNVSMNKDKFPEPEKFLPERFLEDKQSSDNQSYPFGYGKRRCPGEVLARNFMYIVLAGILHQYKLAPPYRKAVPTVQPNIGIIHTAKPYTISIIKRKN